MEKISGLFAMKWSIKVRKNSYNIYNEVRFE